MYFRLALWLSVGVWLMVGRGRLPLHVLEQLPVEVPLGLLAQFEASVIICDYILTFGLRRCGS